MTKDDNVLYNHEEAEKLGLDQTDIELLHWYLDYYSENKDHPEEMMSTGFLAVYIAHERKDLNLDSMNVRLRLGKMINKKILKLDYREKANGKGNFSYLHEESEAQIKRLFSA